MRRIASNTGPILHLLEIGALDLLREAGEVCVPPVVQEELRRGVVDMPSQPPEWIKIREVDGPHAALLEPWLGTDAIHPGEAAALALAKQIQADWFLTDDAAARLVGRTLGLEVHGTLGVLLWAAATHQVDRDDAHTFLDRLTRSSLWMSPRILAEARSALQSIYT